MNIDWKGYKFWIGIYKGPVTLCNVFFSLNCNIYKFYSGPKKSGAISEQHNQDSLIKKNILYASYWCNYNKQQFIADLYMISKILIMFVNYPHRSIITPLVRGGNSCIPWSYSFPKKITNKGKKKFDLIVNIFI